MSSSMKRLGTRLGTHWGALGIACAPVWAAADGARDVVEQLHGELSELVGAGETLDSDARHARVTSAVTRSHDFDALARSSLGSAWEDLHEADRAGYVEAFAQDCVAYYAAHLGDYAAGGFTIAAAEPNGSGGASVAATPAGPGGTGGIVYELGRLDSSWRITAIEQDGKDPFGGLHAVARRLEFPRSVVQRLQAELLEVMKAADSLGYAGRHARLAPVLEDTHDFASIAKLSFSRRWKDLDEAQQDQAVDHIRRLGYATYAGRFDGYNKEAFAVTGEDSIKGGAVVTTELVKSDGAKVELRYLLSRSGGEWKIVNIIADGVSDLATKQAEYASILKRKGFAELLSTLQDQIKGFEEG